MKFITITLDLLLSLPALAEQRASEVDVESIDIMDHAIMVKLIASDKIMYCA